jgi:hypothetical protein
MTRPNVAASVHLFANDHQRAPSRALHRLPLQHAATTRLRDAAIEDDSSSPLLNTSLPAGPKMSLKENPRIRGLDVAGRHVVGIGSHPHRLY